MSSISHKINQLNYYTSLVNPFVDLKTRVCRTYGHKVEGYYDSLGQSQWWSEEKLKVYQAGKLKTLIKNVYENVPYYNEIMKENKLTPDDIKSIEDLRNIPILTKGKIRENSKRIISRSFSEDASVPMSTGASTGEPLIFFQDKNANDLAWGAFLRFLGWMGYEWGDKIAYFWRTPKALEFKGTWYQNIADWIKSAKVMNVDHYDAFRMSDDDLAGYADRLRRNQPDIIRGYSGFIVHLTNYCIRNNIKGIHPKAITTTAEPLFKRERNMLEEYFHCKVFDHYGCGEVFSVAFECEMHNGLHINAEHCIVEIIDDDGNPVEDSSEGRIILTDLDNFTMPFIRYENGDIGSLKEGTCVCGRSLPLMNHVDGRVFGLIKGVNGNVVHGEFFSDMLDKLGWFSNYELKHFEVVQNKIDGFECNFVCDVMPDKKAIQDFIESCKSFFGNMKINVNFMDKIPLTAVGKRRNTRSEIDPIRTSL